MQPKIAVVGQGYVGLPLAMAAAKVGFIVIGLDSNFDRVSSLNKFIPNIEGINSDDLKEITVNGNYSATSDFSKLS